MNNLTEEYEKRKDIIKNRLKEFSKVGGDDIFYELCFCILTPQSNARKCGKAVNNLKKKDFLHKNINPKGCIKEIRFYNNKSRYLLGAKDYYKKIGLGKDAKQLRDFLVANIKGIGYKETSHFLRNIGCRNLAILDRHVLRNLKRYNIIDEVPKTLTRKRYLEIEDKLYKFSKKVKIPMDELDLLFWSMETGEVFK